MQAGQASKELDFELMGEGFTFVNQLQNAECMHAWKEMAVGLAQQHWTNAGLTEAEGDVAEPKTEGWETQSKYEITTRANGTKTERDKLCLNQRRHTRTYAHTDSELVLIRVPHDRSLFGVIFPQPISASCDEVMVDVHGTLIGRSCALF